MATAWVEIPLTQGKRALIDVDKYPQVQALMPWFAHYERGRWYAHRMIGSRAGGGKRDVLRMHTLVSGFRLTDHKNRDGLDNRQDNLEDSNVADNCRNARLRPDNTSGFTGVSYCKRTRRWIAHVAVHGKRVWLGRHPTAEAARDARQEYLASL